LKQEIEKVERQLKETGFDEKRLLGQREIVAREREEARSLKKEAADCRELAKEIRARLEVIRQGKKQMEETEQEIAFAEKAVEKIVLFSNALVSTQAGLRGVLIEAVNAAMNDVWQKVYPYGDFSSAKMEISGGDYELMVRERSGRWVRVEGILSGGERSAAAICIRIAFSLVLARNLSWLILDEPTHNLDANAVRVLSEMMREHLPGLVEQIFVITHDKQMEKAASASLYLLERNKGEDGITNPLMKEASD
jgi:DNA repair exonuclease SbcCD ATPase subunit